MADSYVIRSGRIEATFGARGAELLDLRADGRELLWNGEPDWWNYRAPILFPSIGKSPDGQVAFDGVPHPMPAHGFARDLPFRCVSATDDEATFELSSDAGTRSHYPFDFTLRISAHVDDTQLAIVATIRNDGSRPMPYCFGYHPGFLWPQEPARRSRFVCLFEREEAAEIRRIDQSNGLLMAQCAASPLQGRSYRPCDSDFEGGAVLFDSVRSRRLWFGEQDRRGIGFHFPECTQLAIWTRPGAPFLCIEPWQGMTAEDAGRKELRARIGARRLAPYACATAPLTIRPAVTAVDALGFATD